MVVYLWYICGKSNGKSHIETAFLVDIDIDIYCDIDMMLEFGWY